MARSKGSSWAERLGLHRRDLRAWALYDLANSAFVTTIISAVFPPFFASLATHGETMTAADASAKLALTTAIAISISAVVAPILGAIGDYVPIKKKFLAFFLAIGAVTSGLMFFLAPGDWQRAAILFAIANIAATGSFVFYDSLLPHIAKPDEIDRVSTAGYALGYLGGAALLAVQLAAIANPGWFGLDGPGAAVRLSFVSVAIWWIVFSIPLFRRVPEPPIYLRSNAPRGIAIVGRAIAGLIDTLRDLRRFKHALIFMIAFLIYNDGISTIFRMALTFGHEIGIPQETLITAILLTQIIGVPFAFLFGALAGSIGAKKAIMLGLTVYGGISIFGFFVSESWHFLCLAVIVGMVQGGTQGLSRSLFASMIPKTRAAEFFGLFAVFERFAAVLGPLVFAIVATSVGSSRPAILAVIAFFIIGGLVLRHVDVDAGRAAAREAEGP